MQTCSEIVMPIGIGKNKTMFPADPFNLKEYMNSCENSYGVVQDHTGLLLIMVVW